VRFTRITLRTRMLGLAGVGALLTGAVGVSGLVGYARVGQAGAQQAAVEQARAATARVAALQHQVRGNVWFALTAADEHGHDITPGGTEALQPEIRAELDTLTRSLTMEAGKLAEMDADGELRAQVQRLARSEEAYADQATRIVDLAFSDWASAIAAVPSFEHRGDGLDSQSATVQVELDRMFTTAARNSRAARSDARNGMLGSIASAVVLLVGLSLLLVRSVIGMLRRVGDVAREITGGDLDARIEVDRDDELGMLARRFNETADSVGTLVEQLAAEAERAAFGRDLVEAFEMADAEADALDVVSRAMSIVSTTTPMELLLADSSNAHLEAAAVHREAGSPECSVTSPFGCLAVRRGNPLVFPTSRALNACPKLASRGQPLSAVCVPVTFMGRALGVLHATGEEDAPPPPEMVNQLATLATLAGGRIGTVRSFERTQLQAATDGLTGLANRRTFETEARDLLATGRVFALAMADIDNFKLLNDTYGHEAGDRALRLFAEAMRAVTRNNDLLARIGGEEFAIALPGLSSAQAVAVVDRMRGAIHDATVSHPPTFTVSFGVVDSTEGESLDLLLRLADGALYRAKDQGRNRVIVADVQDKEPRRRVQPCGTLPNDPQGAELDPQAPSQHGV
jgi:diguanylate cyclase (GGDEF)-like protein